MFADVKRLEAEFAQIHEHWSPRVIARVNDQYVKLAKLKGEFVWHAHEHTDEVFLVLNGEMRILFRQGEVRLGAGEMYVVPRGVEHKPVADQECHVLLVEPRGVVNTGASGGPKTAQGDVWI